MKTKLFFIFIVCTLLLSGCIFPDLPSTCDDAPDESVLCSIASKSNMRLEDVGGAMIIINSVLIAEGAYTKADAQMVISLLLDSLTKSVTYAIFKDKFLTYSKSYPDLVKVADCYLETFSLQKQMCQFDRSLLIYWLTERLEKLK